MTVFENKMLSGLDFVLSETIECSYSYGLQQQPWNWTMHDIGLDRIKLLRQGRLVTCELEYHGNDESYNDRARAH